MNLFNAIGNTLSTCVINTVDFLGDNVAPVFKPIGNVGRKPTGMEFGEALDNELAEAFPGDYQRAFAPPSVTHLGEVPVSEAIPTILHGRKDILSLFVANKFQNGHAKQYMFADSLPAEWNDELGGFSGALSADIANGNVLLAFDHNERLVVTVGTRFGTVLIHQDDINNALSVHYTVPVGVSDLLAIESSGSGNANIINVLLGDDDTDNIGERLKATTNTRKSSK